MKEETKEEYKYIVREKIIETPNVSTLKLGLADDTVPKYLPGQFITVYFPETGAPEGKAYSVSNAPGEKTLNITVKAIGEFSNRLCAMNRGDTVIASSPYGYFYSESETSPLIMLAAGIGITPFRSMIQNAVQNTPSRKLILYYSNETVRDIVFRNEFDELQKTHDNFKATYFITREEDIPQNMVGERIRADLILKKAKGPDNPEFLICGTIPFVSDLWRNLRDSGVSEETIYTEAFFS